MTDIAITSTHPKYRKFGEQPVEAHVHISFPPGYAKAALEALCLAVMDVLVEARKVDGTHG